MLYDHRERYIPNIDSRYKFDQEWLIPIAYSLDEIISIISLQDLENNEFTLFGKKVNLEKMVREITHIKFIDINVNSEHKRIFNPRELNNHITFNKWY